MILTTQEINFVKEHKEIIKEILNKRKQDIVNSAISNKDEKQRIKLLDLAEQFGDGITTIDNIDKKVDKKPDNKNTGI
jgi:hypothetical protein